LWIGGDDGSDVNNQDRVALLLVYHFRLIRRLDVCQIAKYFYPIVGYESRSPFSDKISFLWLKACGMGLGLCSLLNAIIIGSISSFS